MKYPLTQFFQIWWLKYLRIVRQRVPTAESSTFPSWSGISFVYVIAFSIPFCLLAVLPRIIYHLSRQDLFNTLFDLTYLLLFITFLLHKKPSVFSKKVFLIAMLYFVSINLIYQQGTHGTGILYQMMAVIFCAVFFSKNRAYYTIPVNVAIILFFGANLYWNWFPSVIAQDYNLHSWFFYGINFIFINLATIIIIRRVIHRLEKIIKIENQLLSQLADESGEIAALNTKLQKSEEYYKYLFASNPIPMFVFDIETLEYMQVNNAALKQYGYTREEFMTMTMMDIRPPEHRGLTAIQLKESQTAQQPYIAITLHRKKNNVEFPVEIRSNPIVINGRKGKLVLATDITERYNYIKSIEEHNNRLKDIAWIQSHQVRAPLARIMSLVMLLKHTNNPADNKEMLEYLDISASELNDIVTKVIRQAE